jgi:2-iminoacetate synthase ThiH
MLFGFLYLRYYKLIKQKLSFIKIRKVKNKLDKTSKINVDDILDKLKIKGWNGLTEGEKAILFSASKKNHKHDHLN